MPNFEVGAIYHIQETISGRADEEDSKNRYFLYLGEGSVFDIQQKSYVATSTTQNHENSKPVMNFKSGQFGFVSDCHIYFKDDLITYLSKEAFAQLKPEKVGQLDKERLYLIYHDYLDKLTNISKIVRKDIKNCINEALRTYPCYQ